MSTVPIKTIVYTLVLARIVRNRGHSAASSLIIGGGLYALAKALKELYSLVKPSQDFDMPEEMKSMHGGSLVASVLLSHGIKSITTLSGGHISPILVACEQAGIRVVDTRHEANAAFCADGMARLTGKPQVCLVTAGPGLTNVVTPVQNAHMAESPLVVISGAAAILTKGRGALQDIDHISLMKPITKACYSIQRVVDIIPTLRKAFQTAMSGVPGPVYIEIPLDVLYSYNLIQTSLGLTQRETPKGVIAQATRWYLDLHVKRIFANGFQPQDVKPLKIWKPSLPEHAVDTVIAMLKTAERPVLLIGSQAMLQPAQAQALQDAVTKIGVPTFLGGMARGLLGKDGCGVQLRHVRKQALAEADVIILAGMVCDFRLDYGRVLNKRAKIVSVNLNQQTITMNSPAFWRPSVVVNSDACQFLLAVARGLKDGYRSNSFLEKLTELDDAKELDNSKPHLEREMTFSSLAGHAIAKERVNPVFALRTLDEVLPDAVLVADGGDFVGTAAYNVRPRAPFSWLDPGAFGTLGCGAGFALAAKLIYPDRPVVILWGDGSAGYSIMEFDTFARNDLGIIAFVGNDACWSQIAREQVTMLGSDVATRLADTCLYNGIARACGGDGIQVESIEEIKPAIEQALKSASEGTPFLIDVRIAKSDFRAGSISV
jgi:acetolactate synthase-like protein